MVIGDWSLQEGGCRREVLFGREEDVMLHKMIAAINLVPEDVYVTNCIKCCPGEGGIFDRECEQSCYSFLNREISTVNPEVICAMGEAAARMLTGSRDMLVRIRGKFFPYCYHPSRSIAVMPTFHPRFLLRHPELKKATWTDLQAVMRRLQGKRT